MHRRHFAHDIQFDVRYRPDESKRSEPAKTLELRRCGAVTREQQALSLAGGNISKLKDGSLKRIVPGLLDDDGRAISG